ncbi:dicarboxylate/amino acid:cation symporter [Sporosarcina obsidiansis]|uniref:dicarboxylate/amino acid:cation symporter n=1 Tax=Sporosarcina obsidiansis TaxID=2660748 RepID=UPI00129BA66F|nr:dicarboxylate/amino acid:cation symporter [Sporosarcina obsidiansis]
MKLSTRITVGLILGIIFGFILNVFSPQTVPQLNEYVLSPVGKVFLNLIQFVVVPIVFTSLVVGFSSIGNSEKVGRLTGKLLFLYVTTSILALVIGYVTAYVLKPGKMVGNLGDVASTEAKEGQGIIDWLISIVPTNPFEAFATGNLLQIIFTAVLIVIGIRMAGSHAKPFLSFIESVHSIVEKITLLVLKLSPIGVFALISSVIATQGLDIVQKLFVYIIGLLVALALMMIAYFIILSLLHISPKHFWKSFQPTFGIAFGTASSNAALPVAIENAKKAFKMQEDIAGFAIPLGTALKRDGACILQTFNALFVAQLFDVHLSGTQIVALIISALVVSFSTAGVPGAGIIMMSTVLTAAGLPLAGIALVAGVDRLTDGFRTLLNVFGNTANAVILNKWEEKKKVDIEVSNTKPAYTLNK